MNSFSIGQSVRLTGLLYLFGLSSLCLAGAREDFSMDAAQAMNLTQGVIFFWPNPAKRGKV